MMQIFNILIDYQQSSSSILFINMKAIIYLYLISIAIATNNSTLINQATNIALDKLNLNQWIDITQHLDFWQTWSHLQFTACIQNSQYIDQQLKDRAKFLATKQWTLFEISKYTIPSYFRDPGLFDDHNFWNHSNIRMLWDDRQWLGLAYLKLYSVYHVEKYLTVAKNLYQMIVTYNADPNSPDYIGLQWQPGGNYRNTVTNQQFLTFCARLYEITKQQKYLKSAKRQFWLLFEQPKKYINNNTNNVFPDEIGPGGFYTYNQGIALQGLAYLVIYDYNAQYLTQLSRLINGFIRFFKQPGTQKFIFKEFTEGSFQYLRNGSIFRGIVFRHLSWLRKILGQKLWAQLLSRTLILKIFVLDNVQAMMRYQSAIPGYHWEIYETGKFHYYNVFNLFFVLNAGQQLFGIEQTVTQGIQINCNSVIFLESTSSIKQVRLVTYSANIDQGIYQIKNSYLLRNGFNNLIAIIGQNICVSTNNRNVMTLQISYNDKKVVFSLIHIQNQYSKFSLIPDRNGKEIINNQGVRIKGDCSRNSYTYKSIYGTVIQIGSSSIDCKSSGNINIRIDPIMI